MNHHPFTIENFGTLTILLLPFDETFPQLAPYFDQLLYHLSGQFEGHIPMSFGEYHTNANEVRAAREFTLERRSAFQLSLISLNIASLLKQAALSFPVIDRHCDRVMYEIIRAIEKMDGGLKFGSLKSDFSTFEAFHLDHRMRRRVFSSKVKGVG